LDALGEFFGKLFADLSADGLLIPRLVGIALFAVFLVVAYKGLRSMLFPRRDGNAE